MGTNQGTNGILERVHVWWSMHVRCAFGQVSERVVVAVDHGKLGARAQAVVFDFDVIDLMVTDLSPGDHRLDRYRDVVEL